MNVRWNHCAAAAVLLTAASSSPALFAQQSKSDLFAGRWDFTVSTDRGSYPQWMEVTGDSASPTIRIQPRGGAVRPAVSAKRDGEHLLITVMSAQGNRPDMTWDLTASGKDKLTGTQKAGDKVTAQLAADRAPELKRPMPKKWAKAEPLFNGKDLTGWEPLGDAKNNHWTAKNGELVNEEKGANLKTTRTFDDFKLHLEVSCPPEHCNSGIYLRGRYEIQVGTEGGKEASHEMGAIYGYTAPAKEMPIKYGEWETFDITIVGRRVTVVRNGVTMHDNAELAGITGGALDSREAEPGPIFLQGDHTGGLRYRNITIQTPQK